MKIVELMTVPPREHDINWVRAALQAAVELELSTIPPYLCAMWSVKQQDDPVAQLLRSIVLEEMSHMGTACNLLTSVGGTPEINTSAAVPTYPGPLPGGVHPGLMVSLGGLSRERVEHVFMEIEKPESGPVAFHRGRTFPTIGAFYDAISHAFGRLPAGSVTGQRQLVTDFGGPAEPLTVGTVEQAIQAIARIKQQGEGAPGDPVGDPGEAGDDLAHYYKFAEIFHGRRLVFGSDGRFDFTGDPVTFPDVWPVAEVPPQGYPQSADFDSKYKSEVLDALQGAWSAGDKSQLVDAVLAMDSDISTLGAKLVQQQAPDGHGNLAPDFKLTAA